MSVQGHRHQYDERFEPLALALGHLLIAVAMLEMALLTDVVARHAERDGFNEVFETGLVTELDRKSAGVLVGKLRALGYDRDFAARLDAAIAERNRFIHHLFEEPEMMRALAGADVVGLCKRIEDLVDEMYALLGELRPSVNSGMETAFGRSAPEMHAVLKEIDPTNMEEGREREQLEALRELPVDFLGGVSSVDSRSSSVPPSEDDGEAEQSGGEE